MPALSPLVDSHCHLDFDTFGDELPQILARAAEAGVARMITVGTAQRVETAGSAVETARRHPDVLRATVGVHPHDASLADEALLEEVERLCRDPLVVAVGETGLDFHYDNSPRDAQREAFRKQIAIARRVKKPLVIHTRNAPADTLSILHEEGAADVGGVIHCFSEDPAFAKGALDLGFASSFSGIVTFPRNTDPIREAARVQPKDAILVETDAPFLAPIPHRGKRNEPSWVAHTAAFVADLRGDDLDAFRRTTTENACRIFGLPKAP
jgi:TatD DNase family protein